MSKPRQGLAYSVHLPTQGSSTLDGSPIVAMLGRQSPTRVECLAIVRRRLAAAVWRP